MGRRRSFRVVLVVAVVAVVAVAVATDVQAHTRVRRERQTLASARTLLAKTRYLVDAATYAKGLDGGKLRGLQASVAATASQVDTMEQALNASNKSAYIQGVDIGMLHTCLGGVNSALQDIQSGASSAATTAISGVSAACLGVDGDSTGGPVYAFDFPDPFVLRVGGTYYGYATNSAEGNIQIISSNNLTQWTAVGNALPRLPSWAASGGTWAPSVLQVGGTFVLYFSAVVSGGGEECISAATADSPTGPFVDTSTAPLECQSNLAGSIDPSPFTVADGPSYLQWKSNGAGGQPAQLWSEQLDAAGTGFAAGTAPTELLAANQSWEDGVVEAPDLVQMNGRYYLFYSGNNWNSADYAVGVALCSGPLGPCTTLGSPILQTNSSMSGPGGATIFTDTSGAVWMAFDAWLPGSVGYPHSRQLYLRQLAFSGSTPVVQPG
jgi:Glycosyl hydrolases family 43